MWKALGLPALAIRPIHVIRTQLQGALRKEAGKEKAALRLTLHIQISCIQAARKSLSTPIAEGSFFCASPMRYLAL